MSLKINQNQLRENNYYLIMDDSSYSLKPSYILDNYPLKDQIPVKNKKTNLNKLLSSILEDNTEDEVIFLHIKVPKNKKENFNGKLIGIPKTLNNDLSFSYFNSQNCNFILKTWYC